MAYLLVIMVDNSPHEAGDVISWRDENMLTPDGHKGFGIKTLQDERFKVVHVPTMTPARANMLCRPQGGFHDETKRDGTLVPRNPDAAYRAWRFNIDKLLPDRKTNIQKKNKPKNQRFRERGSSIEFLDVINLELPELEADTVLELKPVVDDREGAVLRELR